MDSALDAIMHWLPSGHWFYLLLFLTSLIESLAFVGILFPGSVLIVFGGFLAANGQGEFAAVFIACVLGAILGDLLSYFAGRHYGQRLLRHPLLQRHHHLFHRASDYFTAHGGKSVFFGRFVGFLRPFIPFIAGSARMRPLPFVFYAVVSALLWGIAYPGLGILGGASWHLVQVWTGRFSLLLLLLLALFLLNLVVWRYLVPLLGRFLAPYRQRTAAAIRRLLASPALLALRERYPKTCAFCAARFSPQHPGGLYFSVGFLCSLLFAALFLQVGRIVYLEASLTRFDQRLYELLQLLHHPLSDAFFVAVTTFGDIRTILALGVAVLLALVLANRDFSAVVLLVGIGGGELLVASLKHLFDRPRPLPYFPELAPPDPSFPSGHAFIALVFFGLTVYFLLGNLTSGRSRFLLLLSSSFLVLLISVSRVYLGLHWASDVLAGLLLAALWLTFLITTCQARFRYGGFYLRRGWRPLQLPAPLRYGAVALTLCVALAGIGIGIERQLTRLQLGERPRLVQQLPTAFNLDQASGVAPLHTENLLGKPQRPLSLLLAADHHALVELLERAGWKPTSPVLLPLFRATDDIADAPDAILPRLLQGRMADAGYISREGNVLHTLQLWDLGYRLADGRTFWGLLASSQKGRRPLLGRYLSLPTSTVDVDRERDVLAAQLKAGGARFSAPAFSFLQRGRDVGGSFFSSNGAIFVAELPTSVPAARE